MTLRIEVFAADPDRTAGFYRDVLGFAEELRHRGSDGLLYVAVRRDGVRIGIGTSGPGIDPRVRDLPLGTEIVLEVDDLTAELARVTASGWPILQSITRQEWGLDDFRLLDPDGYYLRLTTRAEH